MPVFLISINSFLQQELNAGIFDCLAGTRSRCATTETYPQSLSVSMSSGASFHQNKEDESEKNATPTSETLYLPQPGIKVQELNLDDLLEGSKLYSMNPTEENQEQGLQSHLTEQSQADQPKQQGQCGYSRQLQQLQESPFLRPVPNTCAICLDPYTISDTVCWSSNPVCSHVFHRDCIVNWLLARNRSRGFALWRTSNTAAGEQDDESIHRNFLTCPCCRVRFIDSWHSDVGISTCASNRAGDKDAADGSSDNANTAAAGAENIPVESDRVTITVQEG